MSLETKENLLDIGAHYFSKKGFNASGLKEILSEANVPKGSFYHYFNSKEDYLNKVLLHYSDGLFELFDGELAKNNPSPVHTLKAIYFELTKLFTSYKCEHGCLLGSMSTEVSAENEAIRKVITTLYKSWRDRHEVLIKKAQKLGEIRCDLSAKELTDIFWNQWQGALLRGQLEKSTKPLKQAISITFDCLYQPQ